jgi:hypothetical protein
VASLRDTSHEPTSGEPPVTDAPSDEEFDMRSAINVIEKGADLGFMVTRVAAEGPSTSTGHRTRSMA